MCFYSHNMSWVNESDLEEYLEELSNPPLQTVQELYTETVTLDFEGERIETSIVSSKPWFLLGERPDISVEDETTTNINESALHDIATINAFQQDRVRGISEDQIGDYIWNGETYVMTDSVDFNRPPELTIQQSDFYSVISHTSRLLGELLTDEYNSVRSHRQKHFDTTGSLARNVGSYHRPLGGTYLTIVRDSDDMYYLLLGRRSNKVVLWSELITAFPAGYFQPNEVSYGDIFDQQLLSEYSQEAMAVSQKRQPTDSSKGVSAISQLLRAGEAEFALTGFGIEATTASAELSGVLLIDYPEYTEYLFNNLEDSHDVSHINAVPLKEEMGDKLRVLLANNKLTPQSAFTLGLGLKHLDEETDIEVPFDFEVLIEQ